MGAPVASRPRRRPFGGLDSNTSSDGVSPVRSVRPRATTPPRRAGRARTPNRGEQLLAASPDGPPSTPPTAPADPTRRRVRWTPTFGPTGAIRARTADAPAACNDTPCQENGTTLPASWSPSVATITACSAASSSAGCTPKPAPIPRLLRQRHLGEHLVAAAPHRGQALERGAVLVAARGQLLVGPSMSTGAAPAGGHTDRSGRVGGAAAARRPRRAASSRSRRRGAREHRHRTAARFVGSADDHLDGHRAGRRDHQRRLQLQLLDVEQPTSSPARIANSTNPAPGNTTTPPTA